MCLQELDWGIQVVTEVEPSLRDNEGRTRFFQKWAPLVRDAVHAEKDNLPDKKLKKEARDIEWSLMQATDDVQSGDDTVYVFNEADLTQIFNRQTESDND